MLYLGEQRLTFYIPLGQRIKRENVCQINKPAEMGQLWGGIINK